MLRIDSSGDDELTFRTLVMVLVLPTCMLGLDQNSVFNFIIILRHSRPSDL